MGIEARETVTAPARVGGASVTGVARTWVASHRGRRHGALVALARPRAVVVTAADGTSTTVPVRDVELAVAGWAVAAAGVALGARAARRRARRRA